MICPLFCDIMVSSKMKSAKLPAAAKCALHAYGEFNLATLNKSYLAIE